MSDLERRIVDKVRQLDKTQQNRVWDYIQSLEPAPFDFETWLAKIDAIHAEILAQHGENYGVRVQGLLAELREEASWPYRVIEDKP